MNESLYSQEKEVLQKRLADEKKILVKLEAYYEDALEEIENHIAHLLGRQDANLPNVINRIEYQRMIKDQVQSSLDKLHSHEYESIEAYLQESYTDAFVGTMYSLHAQEIPIIVPIDQAVVIKAITLNTKLKESLYKSLGQDMASLKKTITSEITRGIASGMLYSDMQRNISNATKMPLSRARTIVRTEAGRVQEEATMEAAEKAKAKGADVVKQWSAILDGKTRYNHRLLDHQIREVDEYFEVSGKKAKQPHGFGDPAEDCNCRCTLLIRARAAFDSDELKKMQERASFHGLTVKDSKAFGQAKAKDFSDFKKKYLKAAETVENTGKSGIIKEGSDNFILDWKQFGKKIGKHAADYGYDPSSEEGRQKMLEIIYSIRNNPTEAREGYWRGQADEVFFFIRGADVVITKKTGEFITIMKGGIANDRVKNARNRKI